LPDLWFLFVFFLGGEFLLFVLGLVVRWFPGTTRIWNDLWCVEQDVNFTLTSCLPWVWLKSKRFFQRKL